MNDRTKDNDTRPATDNRLDDVRRRQQSVGTILDATFGPLAACDPRLWEHRAYLMLVGLVYERLATGEPDLSTDDLVRLARVLADHRRVRKRGPTIEGKTTTKERLPAEVSSAIRAVYGTDLTKQVPDGSSPNGQVPEGQLKTEPTPDKKPPEAQAPEEQAHHGRANSGNEESKGEKKSEVGE